MLLELIVKDFAIIHELNIQFKPGFNVLSGETGAGKSVLLKSLSLLMGYKTSNDYVREGKEKAVVEGCFDVSKRSDILSKLEEKGIDVEEGELVVRRVITNQAKNKIYINGSLSTLATLREVVCPLIEMPGASSPLIEFTSQHESKNLMSKVYHIDIVDHFIGNVKIRKEYQKIWESLNDINIIIERHGEESQKRAQRIDFLKFQINEIDKVSPNPTEDKQLEQDLKKLKYSHLVSEVAIFAEQELYSQDVSVVSRLHQVRQKLESISDCDPMVTQKMENLDSAKAIIEDFVHDFREFSQSFDTHPEALEQMEDRLSELKRIQKKYGSGIEEILELKSKYLEEVNDLENKETSIEELLVTRKKLREQMNDLAEELHQKRIEGAKVLSASVNKELDDLNMNGVKLNVEVDLSEKLNSLGNSDVELFIRSSASEINRPIIKYASGGELSRILLAIKRVVGMGPYARTHLFDEVDTGVSGTTAAKVGKKLKAIAHNQQVICVTHLPQVAAFADHHFFIYKSMETLGAKMNINTLSTEEDRVEEIARLLSGEKITKASVEHARQLIHEIL